MSMSSVTSRNSLLAEARVEWTRSAERKAAATGTRAESVPSDSVLIASDATLSQEIKAAESSTTSSGSGGGASMGGGGGAGASAKTTSLTISASSESASSSSIDATGTASASGGASKAYAAASGSSSAQNGRLVNVLV